MNRQEIEKIYYEWEEQLEKEYNEIFFDAQYTIFDGVVSPFDYFHSPIKVMFLNRESYGDSYNIHEELKKQIEKGEPILGGNYWINQNTKERLALCSLLDKFADVLEGEAIDYAVNLDDKEYRSLLYKSAYCNIKKSNGRERSTKNDLLNYAQKGWSIIEKQVVFFNPTLIIGGNVFDGIIEKIEGLNWGDPQVLYKEKTNSVVIYKIEFGGKPFPFMDMYHPSYMCHSHGLIYALKYLAQHCPDFWKYRIGQKCFEL